MQDVKKAPRTCPRGYNIFLLQLAGKCAFCCCKCVSNLAGIIAACHKRPVSAAEIENIVNSVEQLAYNNLQSEITTRQIGEMVMEELKKLDEVAYIRFASVYRSFTDVPTFMRELKSLVQDRDSSNK